MKILFCGDIVINDAHINISDSLFEIFNKNDYRICNFEGPLVNDDSFQIIKAGPHVKNDEGIIGFLKQLNFNCTALANNHIMDYGKDALGKTITSLNINSIKTVGAGFSFEQVYKPLILENKNERICILNACQAEFGVVKSRKTEVGYAWVNSPIFRDAIKHQLIECDKVILFLHAGMEEQIVPLPEWKQIYHDFADMIQGKGAVIATHPHIVQGYEIYNNTPIFYSLGNFVFYKKELKDNIEWNRSILVQYDTKTNKTDIIPVSIHNNIIDIDNSLEFKNCIEERCNLIKDNAKLDLLADEIAEKAWNNFYKFYYSNLIKIKSISEYTGKQLLKILVKRILNKVFKTKLGIFDIQAFDETMLLHNIQIESHRWCVERYLYNKNIKENSFQGGE